jgi:hypothetical protein
MKTANFKYHGPDANNPDKRPPVTIFGKVTLKDDGKVSISIHDKKSYSFGNVYAAKNYAKAIVASNFTVNAYDVVDTNNNIDLAGILTEKTKDLHDTYIDRSKVYAKNHFAHAQKEFNRPMTEWYDRFGVKYEYKPKTYYCSERPAVPEMVLQPAAGEYNKKGYYKMTEVRNKLHTLVNKIGLEKFMEEEVKHAERHYSDSIIKLASRLREKGVTLEDMTIKSGRIGMNFEIVIDCNGVITKAWTIIAEGPIQRPHYRYLVK